MGIIRGVKQLKTSPIKNLIPIFLDVMFTFDYFQANKIINN